MTSRRTPSAGRSAILAAAVFVLVFAFQLPFFDHWFGLLDEAAEVFKDAPIGVHDGTNLGLEGNAAQSLPPGDPRPPEAPLQRATEARTAFCQRQWASRVGAGNCAQEQRDVAHRSPNRSKHGQRRPRPTLGGHAPR